MELDVVTVALFKLQNIATVATFISKFGPLQREENGEDFLVGEWGLVFVFPFMRVEIDIVTVAMFNTQNIATVTTFNTLYAATFNICKTIRNTSHTVSWNFALVQKNLYCCPQIGSRGPTYGGSKDST